MWVGFYIFRGDARLFLESVLSEFSRWLDRFDCLIIGPGLGRDPFLLVGNRHFDIIVAIHLIKGLLIIICLLLGRIVSQR